MNPHEFDWKFDLFSNSDTGVVVGVSATHLPNNSEYILKLGAAAGIRNLPKG